MREFEAEGVLDKAADICRRVADEAADLDASSKEMRVLANCLRSIHKACDVPRFAEAVAADVRHADTCLRVLATRRAPALAREAAAYTVLVLTQARKGLLAQLAQDEDLEARVHAAARLAADAEDPELVK